MDIRIAGAGLGLLLIGTQTPNIVAGFGQASTEANAIKTQADATRKIEAKKMVLDERAELANARYDQGCELIVLLKNLSTATTIQEGRPIVAGSYAKQFDPRKDYRSQSGMFVGRDITVCDGYGTTAVMEFRPELGYAVASDIAVTPDRDRMAKALQRRPGVNRPNLGK